MKPTDAAATQLGTKLVVRSTFHTHIATVIRETPKHWVTDTGLILRKRDLHIKGSTAYDSRQLALLDSDRGRAWLDQRELRAALQAVREQVKQLTTQACGVQRELHRQGKPGPLDELLATITRLRTLSEKD